MTRISVVVPTYNRLERLRQVLTALERQTYPRQHFEVIVVSDGCQDGTNQALAAWKSQLRLAPVFQPNQGPAAARNHGVAKASGEIILFLDDDVIPAPGLIAEHISTHEELGDKVVVLGPMLTPAEYKMLPWVKWEQAMLEKQYEAMRDGVWEPTARQFYTGNSSLARRSLIEAGGFDAQFRRAEDVELAYRLSINGLRFVFNPQAIGYHYADRSFLSWYSTAYDYGKNDVIFSQQKGQAWLLPVVWKEYLQRNVLVRSLATLCLDRPKATVMMVAGLRRMIEMGERLNLAIFSQSACSGIFNLRYYQGVCDQLGGRNHFFSGAERERQSYYR